MEETITQKPANPYLIPLAIVIAGGLIAGALYIGTGRKPQLQWQ